MEIWAVTAFVMENDEGNETVWIIKYTFHGTRDEYRFNEV